MKTNLFKGAVAFGVLLAGACAAFISYAATGSISVSTPNCVSGQNCTAVVTWTTSGTDEVVVKVTSNPGLNGVTNDFSYDLSCADTTCGTTGNWLVPGNTYVFNLYDKSANSLIDSAQIVIAPENNNPTPTPTTPPPAAPPVSNIPVGNLGSLNPGWSSMGAGWYYNASLGLYSNADGTIQDTTSNGFGAKMQAASIARVGISESSYLMSGQLCVYYSVDKTFTPLNGSSFATIETANRMAAIFGGTVESVYLDEQGPFRNVNICSFPPGQGTILPSNIIPQYSVRVGNYLGNAGLMAKNFLIYPYDQAKSMIQAEIDRAATYGSFPKPDPAKAGLSSSTYLMPAPICGYTSFDNSFAQNNTSQFATLDTAKKMAALFGGTVAQEDLGPLQKYVNVCSLPILPQNVVHMYSVKVGNYQGNAGLMAYNFFLYPYDEAKSMIQAEINRANGSGSTGGIITTPPTGSGTSGGGTVAGTPTSGARQQIQVSNDAAIQLRLQQLQGTTSSGGVVSGPSAISSLPPSTLDAIREQIRILLLKVQELQAQLDALIKSGAAR